MLMPAGGQYDPEGRSGLSSLTAAVLDEGTQRRSALEIAATAERLGGYFATGADWDVGYLATGLLASHWREGVEVLAGAAPPPTLSPAQGDPPPRPPIAPILRRSPHPPAPAPDPP